MVVPEGERIAAVEATIKAILAQGQEREQHNDARFKGLMEKLDEKHAENKAYNQAILTQVTTTNGRVSALEAWKLRIEGGVAGSRWVIGIVCGMAGFIAKPILESLIHSLVK